ncbi:MAG: hypothetical protein ACI9GM_001273 [Salibacteraceae bacterium]|jgi:hypothetical protein
MKKLFSFLVVFVVFFASCEKDEIPVAKHAPGEVETQEVRLGNYYPDQVWYNIAEGVEVSRNNKTAWDLAFENNAPGWRLTINSANNAYISPTGKTDITQVKDTIGAIWKWDEFSGNLDSTAIGNWQDQSQIYILDRGKDELGKPLGTSKFLIDSVDANTFYFRHAAINEDTWTTANINKDSSYFFSYFSLIGTGNQVQIAPPTQDWDLLFSQYTFVFYDMTPIVPYLVTGVLFNPSKTYSTQVFDKPFEAISSSDILSPIANQRIDNIGYNWKRYDFDQGYYITDPSKNYVFRTQNDKMYKLHFLDFYSQQGEKGTISFEYSEL